MVVAVVVVVVVMFGEGYRARRQCKDRRKGNRTNLHRFLLINARKWHLFLSRGNERLRCEFRVLQPLRHSQQPRQMFMFLSLPISLSRSSTLALP